MSKYIRLYCNNQKIRSCCNTKWQRDNYFNKLSTDKDYDEMTYVDKETYLRFLISQTPHELRTSKNVLKYTIEVVKKGRDGNKRVIKSFKLKYKIYSHAIPIVFKLEEDKSEGTRRVYHIMLTNRG